MNLAARPGDGAFEDAVDTQRPGNFGQWPPGAFILHNRGAGYDAQCRVLGKHRDEFVAHPVGKVLLAGISGKVIERENRE